MPSEKRAVYAGSFDPLTNGHVEVIRKAAGLFDVLTVFVTDNPSKKHLFDLEQRSRIVSSTIHDHLNLRNAQTSWGRGVYTVQAVRGFATYLVRGLRTSRDLEEELVVQEANRLITTTLEGNPIETWYVAVPPELAVISSTLVRSLVGPPGWERVIERLVPPASLGALKERFPHGDRT